MTSPHQFPSAIDSSMLKTFKSCPRKFELQYLRHLHPTATSIHLQAGGAFAKGLETVRTSFHKHHKSPEESIHDGHIAAIKEWGHGPMRETEPKGLQNILLCISEYFAHHGLATDTIQPYNSSKIAGITTPAVEFSFALPIGVDHPETGEPLLYCGRFDMLGVYNNTLFVVDEKTTSRLGATWLQQWDLHSQFTGYCWAAQQYGYPVAGAVVRGVSILSKDFGFADVITFRPPHLIERWHRTTQDYIHLMIESWKRNEFTFNLDDACTAYGGCPFKRESCDKADPEAWLSNFVVRKWTPLHTTGETDV